MTKKEAIRIANQTARHEGWKLKGPLAVSKQRRWPVFGRTEWQVSAHEPEEQRHTWVRIDDRDGEVIASGWRLGPPLRRSA